MMDCVLPSRSGRTGQAWTRWGQVNIKNARHQDESQARPKVSIFADVNGGEISGAFGGAVADGFLCEGRVILTGDQTPNATC